jgi:hypothetical protein
MASLATKLGLLPGMTALLLDAPGAAVGLLEAEAPTGMTIETSHRNASHTRYDLIFFWPRSLEGLASRFDALQWDMEPDGALWVVMPKQAAAKKRGITFSWNEMQAAALSTDLVDNKIASLDQEEYATHFVIRRERRHAYRSVAARPS